MRLLGGLLVAAMMLAGIIAWEVTDAQQVDTARPVMQAATTSAAQIRQVSHVRDWIATTLARPLFSPDRRPSAETLADTASGPTDLPRLTGIVVGPTGRSAIFAGADKPIVIGEGGHIAAFTVQSIDMAQVQILGPDGLRVLRPAFDSVAASPGMTLATTRHREPAPVAK